MRDVSVQQSSRESRRNSSSTGHGLGASSYGWVLPLILPLVPRWPLVATFLCMFFPIHELFLRRCSSACCAALLMVGDDGEERHWARGDEVEHCRGRKRRERWKSEEKSSSESC